MKTPLVDLLKDVPEAARGDWPLESGGYALTPYGRLCHEAADRIIELEAENERLRETLKVIALGNLHYPQKLAAQVIAELKENSDE